MERAAAAAAAAVLQTPPSPPPASLSAPFPPSCAPSLPSTTTNASGANKRRLKKASTANNASPLNKKAKKAADRNATDCEKAGSAGAIVSSAPTPEATAAWSLVKGEVAKFVRDGNEALWAALKQSKEQIEHLQADANRLEARVDSQGQGNERTAMAVGFVRVAVKNGIAAAGAHKDGGSSSGTKDSNALVKDEKPVINRDAAKAAAIALAPDNEVKAAQLRRPIRAAVKNLVATADMKRNVLMDSATCTVMINEEAIKAFGMTPTATHSYLMDFIYFPSAVKEAPPTLKRPHTVIEATISHAVAKLNEFVLKPYFKVLGLSYNPMPPNKANKWYKDESFLTSYKGDEALVAAAKNLFVKIGGSFRIVKVTGAGSCCHVDMTVGHYSLIGSFVRNEFQIALGRRQRRRKGNGSSTYFHWVDEIAHSVKHLAKNHKDHKIHAGYRITDAVDPDIVARTTSGGWVFTAPVVSSVPPSSAGKAASATPTTSARPPLPTKRTGAASWPPPASSRASPAAAVAQRAASLDHGVTVRPATEDGSVGGVRNCVDDYGVGCDDDGRPSDGQSDARASGIILAVDSDDANDRAGAAAIGLSDGGGGATSGGIMGWRTTGWAAVGRGATTSGAARPRATKTTQIVPGTLQTGVMTVKLTRRSRTTRGTMACIKGACAVRVPS
ncbi:hypothetical protein BU14_0251s0010 [Porphyra umbilicalis]|uniref:Uncharacterized protein n=1 Tax=Porphyra umbilicalis TaxID=2786 RepID=A0A1X6P342_PORUM|nr:hypothetical protein BU14_0251s0010 [Porphyra umbilicalis]|eukprot:OSX75170.1 hypothetical protein BU14_0251s0010 [Porphyra umbilicalis]